MITNRKIIKKDGFLQVIEDASAGGADFIILREKDLETDELLEIAYKIKEQIKDKDTGIIINGNLFVAEKIKAHGVHYSFNEFKKNRPYFSGLVGVSVHSLEEAVEAERLSADYVLAGHIFETDCKKGLKPRGINFIKDIKGKINIPVIALGGINFDNADSVLNAGADGLAVMSLIMSSEDPYKDTSKLKNIILRDIG